VNEQLLNGTSAQIGYSMPYTVSCQHLVKQKYNKPRYNSKNTNKLPQFSQPFTTSGLQTVGLFYPWTYWGHNNIQNLYIPTVHIYISSSLDHSGKVHDS